jgi:hypothetical protein
LQAVAETENSLQESYTELLTINQEKIKVFRRERWAELKNYISKPKAIIFKKIRRFINSTVKTAIAKHDYSIQTTVYAR